MNQTPAIAQLRLRALNTAARMRSAAAVKYMMEMWDKRMHHNKNYRLSTSIAVSA
jgi:hypothetical protein